MKKVIFCLIFSSLLPLGANADLTHANGVECKGEMIRAAFNQLLSTKSVTEISGESYELLGFDYADQNNVDAGYRTKIQVTDRVAGTKSVLIPVIKTIEEDITIVVGYQEVAVGSMESSARIVR